MRPLVAVLTLLLRSGRRIMSRSSSSREAVAKDREAAAKDKEGANIGGLADDRS